MYETGYECQACKCLIAFPDKETYWKFAQSPDKQHTSQHGKICNEKHCTFNPMPVSTPSQVTLVEWTPGTVEERKAEKYKWWIRCGECEKNTQKFSDESEYKQACEFHNPTGWVAWCDTCKKETKWAHGAYLGMESTIQVYPPAHANFEYSDKPFPASEPEHLIGLTIVQSGDTVTIQCRFKNMMPGTRVMRAIRQLALSFEKDKIVIVEDKDILLQGYSSYLKDAEA